MTGLLTDRELMARLRMRKSTFYAKKKAGALDRFKVVDPIGTACWSLARIEAYERGERVIWWNKQRRRSA